MTVRSTAEDELEAPAARGGQGLAGLLLAGTVWLLTPVWAAGQQAVEATTCPSPLAERVWVAVREEGKRYARDLGALVGAPLSWSSEDLRRGVVIGLAIGGLMLVDEQLDHEAQDQRSAFTDRVSSSTTGFGGQAGLYVSAGLLAGGLIFQDGETREMGREALEASIFTHLLNKYALKPAFGRRRPADSNGETSFHPFSRHSSFPSGHATQAFAIASVVAARSKGWILPTLAYAAATVVAFDRVNDRAHFASDVFGGAVLGTLTGRFLVNRHRNQTEGTRASATVTPIPDGVAVQIRF
jgi:hypothetical protein